jgi:hypothetical protein
MKALVSGRVASALCCILSLAGCSDEPGSQGAGHGGAASGAASGRSNQGGVEAASGGRGGTGTSGAATGGRAMATGGALGAAAASGSGGTSGEAAGQTGRTGGSAATAGNGSAPPTPDELTTLCQENFCGHFGSLCPTPIPNCTQHCVEIVNMYRSCPREMQVYLSCVGELTIATCTAQGAWTASGCLNESQGLDVCVGNG